MSKQYQKLGYWCQYIYRRNVEETELSEEKA